MTSWGRQPGDLDPADDGPITSEDLARRIGAAHAGPPPGRGGGDRPPLIGQGHGPAHEPSRAQPAARVRRHAHPMRVIPGPTRRIVLWRDASAVLFVVVVVLVLGQVVLPPGVAGPTLLPSTLVAGESSQVMRTIDPDATGPTTTLGPVIDPSLIPGLVETATPTLRPRASQAPRPSAPPATQVPAATADPAPPTSTPPPTPDPTPPPTSSPTPPATPSPTPAPTPPPAPIAAFDCTASLLEITCTDASSYADTYFWEFGDGGTSTASNPSHTYLAPGTYTVTLTVTNATGQATSSREVTVP